MEQEAEPMDEEGEKSGFEQAAAATNRSGLQARAGVVLLGLSVGFWVPLPVLPFLPMSGGAKAAWAGGLVVGAEVAFWLGALLAGPEAARRMRSWLRHALRRDRPASEPATPESEA